MCTHYDRIPSSSQVDWLQAVATSFNLVMTTDSPSLNSELDTVKPANKNGSITQKMEPDEGGSMVKS
jgi:hypothetical protein